MYEVSARGIPINNLYVESDFLPDSVSTLNVCVPENEPFMKRVSPSHVLFSAYFNTEQRSNIIYLLAAAQICSHYCRLFDRDSRRIKIESHEFGSRTRARAFSFILVALNLETAASVLAPIANKDEIL